MPLIQLGIIDYAGDPLRTVMDRHVARFDCPGHYLRVSVLFRSQFWRDTLDGPWFMSDAFDGTCVYDESARYDARGYGVLGFLIAGNAALALMNLDEEEIVDRVLAALPDALRSEAGAASLEARVHRWCAGLSAQSGGLPLSDPVTTHQPGGDRLPGLFVVGDYLHDATLNGVYRSADLATDLLARRLFASAPSGASAPILSIAAM